MRQILAVLALAAAMLAASPARAQLAVSAGMEYFRWKEDTAPIEVNEEGVMFVLGLDYTQRKEQGLLFAYRGKFYVGDMDYDGAFLFAPSVSADGSSTYIGTAHEAQMRYRVAPQRGYQLDVVASAGFDLWERELSDIQQEGYTIAFLRFGLELNAAGERGWTFGAGIKFPVWTEEDAHFTDLGFDQNPTLEPEGKVMGYGHAGYRFRRNLALIGYLDGFNFGKSDPVTVTDGAASFQFFQPASRQYNVGLKLQYLF
ncbi:MAG TPA: hypothetical protein VFU53_03615 [Burkholderiales bacterium]|nr:hypothetical protein [Burkholderiales bacterium]